MTSYNVKKKACTRFKKKVREKSRECHNHKPQPFPDPKRKRKPTNLNKHKPNKRTKSTKISSLFPKPGNRNTKRTEKHKNKKTYNKSPRKINHKATKSKTNTGTTALERSVEQTTGELVLVLLFVALWFILRGDLLYVFPCVILSLCFSVLLVLRLPLAITSLGEERANLCAFCTFVRFVLV